jgi:hypothetical protein
VRTILLIFGLDLNGSSLRWREVDVDMNAADLSTERRDMQRLEEA